MLLNKETDLAKAKLKNLLKIHFLNNYASSLCFKLNIKRLLIP